MRARQKREQRGGLALEHVLQHDGSLSDLFVDEELFLVGGLEGDFVVFGGHGEGGWLSMEGGDGGLRWMGVD